MANGNSSGWAREISPATPQPGPLAAPTHLSAAPGDGVYLLILKPRCRGEGMTLHPARRTVSTIRIDFRFEGGYCSAASTHEKTPV